MELNGIIGNYDLPIEAVEDLKARHMKSIPIEDGVSRFHSGHDKGVAFRFFTHTIYNRERSALLGYEVFDEEDMIEWLVEKGFKPTEKVRFLPSELLRFREERVLNSQTGRYDLKPIKEVIDGRYSEAYRRFKAGLDAPGLNLSKWGVCSDSMVATFNAREIYTVEQLAAQSRDRMKGLPDEFIEAFERAIQFVNSKDTQELIQKQTEQIVLLSQQSRKKDEELEALKAEMKEFLAIQRGAKAATGKRRGMPKGGWPKKEVAAVEEKVEGETYGD